MNLPPPRQALRIASRPLVQSALRIAGAVYACMPTDSHANDDRQRVIVSCKRAMESARDIADFIARLG